MLEEKALTGEEAGWLGNNCMFHLDDPLLSDTRLELRLKLLLLVHSRLDRLAKSDPTNAERQHDLSVSYNKLGDIYTAQGDIPKALKAYEQTHAISDRLAESDPHNALWQRDLAVSFYKLAGVSGKAGDWKKETEYPRRCRDVLRGMSAKGMHLDPQAAQLLELLDQMPL